jgi:hypothetical protein
MFKFNSKENVINVNENELNIEKNNIKVYKFANYCPTDFFDEKTNRTIELKGLAFLYKDIKLILHRKRNFIYVSEYYSGMSIDCSLISVGDALYRAFTRIDSFGIDKFKNRLNYWERIN